MPNVASTTTEPTVSATFPVGYDAAHFNIYCATLATATASYAPTFSRSRGVFCSQSDRIRWNNDALVPCSVLRMRTTEIPYSSSMAFEYSEMLLRIMRNRKRHTSSSPRTSHVSYDAALYDLYDSVPTA